MIDYIEDRDMTIRTLMYDGLMVDHHEDLTEDFLRGLEEFIENQTTISIKLKYKPTETDWTPEFDNEI